MQTPARGDAELRRFRAEAEQLMGIPAEAQEPLESPVLAKKPEETNSLEEAAVNSQGRKPLEDKRTKQDQP